MEIRVLGDLTIDSGRLSPKERSLLAVLVLRSGSVVSPSELADAVWGDDVPATTIADLDPDVASRLLPLLDSVS